MTALRLFHRLVRMATTGPPHRASRTEPTHHSRSRETPMTSVSQLATSVNADVTPSIGQFAQQKLHPAILALDLGTTTGWAIGGGSGQHHQRHHIIPAEPLRRRRHALSALPQLARSDRHRCWRHRCRVLRRSAPQHAGTDAAHVYGGFLATLTAWCEEAGIAYQGVPVGTIKRHVDRQGQCRQGRRHRCHPRARLQSRRRQRGRCARHPAVGQRDPRRCAMNGEAMLKEAANGRR